MFVNQTVKPPLTHSVAQVRKPNALRAVSSNNAAGSFESSTHYEDINVTSKEYATHDDGGGGGGGVCRIKYPKVLPDFPGPSAAERRLSLPPSPLAGIPEVGSLGKIPPPPPPRISSTLGRKSRDAAGPRPLHQLQLQPTSQLQRKPVEPVTEEHKSPVVPCVPNKVCPPSVRKPIEPRVVIKPGGGAAAAATAGAHQQQSRRTNIPRVVHPQNSDSIRTGSGDTGTVKRKKK